MEMLIFDIPKGARDDEEFIKISETLDLRIFSAGPPFFWVPTSV